MKYLKFPYTKFVFSFFLLLLAIFILPRISFAQVVVTTDDDEPPSMAVPMSKGAAVIRSVDEEDESKTPGATVHGRVTYSDTGRPVRRAEISLNFVTKEGYSDRSKKVITNSDGEFEVKNVKPGTYTTYIKIPGVFNENSFNLTTQTLGENKDEKKAALNQIVVIGLEEVNVQIEAKRGGAVTGKISYFDGEPAIGMKVEVLRKGPYGYEKNTRESYGGNTLNISAATTDDRGVYRFSGLPEGSYLVRVIETAEHTTRPSNNYYYSSESRDSELKTYYPNTASAKDAKPVDLALGQEQSEINLTIPERKFFSIKGIVVAKNDKKPLRDFIVGFTRIDEEGAQVVRDFSYQQENEKTSAQGEWDFVDLPQGKYLISVRPPYEYETRAASDRSAGGAEKSQPEKPKYAPISKEVTFEEKNVSDFVFEMPFEAVISGTLVMENGKPLPPYIYLGTIDPLTNLPGSSAFVQTQTGAAKNTPVLKTDFTLKGLKEGTHNLFASSDKAYIKEITAGGATVSNRKFEIKEGQQITGVQIVLSSDYGTIKGTVSNFDKKLRTFVGAFPAGKSMAESFMAGAQGLVKADGTFEFKVPPGEYSVFVLTENVKFDPKTENREDFFKRVTKNATAVSVKINEAAEANLSVTDQ